jgi:hypothetical protein
LLGPLGTPGTLTRFGHHNSVLAKRLWNAYLPWSHRAARATWLPESAADLPCGGRDGHSYAEEGAYRVTLTVTDTVGGLVKVARLTDTVTEAALTTTPSAPLEVTQCVPFQDQFLATFHDDNRPVQKCWRGPRSPLPGVLRRSERPPESVRLGCGRGPRGSLGRTPLPKH